MKWKYKVVALGLEVLEHALNEWGAEGWELVHMDIDRDLNVFKRPLPDPEPALDKKAVEGYFGGKIG